MRRPPSAPRKHWSRIATVSDETYHDALRRFDEKGLIDLVILAGCYQLVCGVLTLFAVPAREALVPLRRINPMLHVTQAGLMVVAEFPERFFLENLAVRRDGSMLVTVLNRKELWFVPAPDGARPAQPVPLHGFEFNTTFVVEWQPDRFLLGVADVYDTHQARLYEIDLTGWSPGNAITPRLVLELPRPWAGLNGACFVAPNVLLAAGRRS